ncbi:MAG: transposase [Actinomycetota bacterium]|nr:transposase [Actinomycetota bacterium]
MFHGGAEEGGIYWRNIFSFFRRTMPWAKLSLLNPLQTRRFKELELHRVKTDAEDARTIARFVATFEPEPAPDLPSEYLDLCELCRFRKLKASEHARYLNHLHKYLKQAFP